MAAYVDRSLAILRRECPTAYLAVCGRLAFATVELRVDHELVRLAFRPRVAELRQELADPDVRLQTTRATILEVLDAKVTLEQAVRSGAVLLWGSSHDLARCNDALLDYVRGAVRCPSLPALLDRFRYRGPARAGAGR
jgi:hypothetical protein